MLNKYKRFSDFGMVILALGVVIYTFYPQDWILITSSIIGVPSIMFYDFKTHRVGKMLRVNRKCH